jgi:hypothetical protein
MLSYPPVYVAPPIWQQKFSRGWAATIGVLQMFVTFEILACETLSMLTSIEYAFLFIGYGASWWFIITWISVYGSGEYLRVPFLPYFSGYTTTWGLKLGENRAILQSEISIISA